MDDSYAKFTNTIKFKSILEEATPSDEPNEEQSEQEREKISPPKKSGYDFSR